ncbi:MAG: serine/threonine protein kinase [Thermogutta sp.]
MMASEDQWKQWSQQLARAGLPEVLPLADEHLAQITSFSQFLDLAVERKVLTPWQAAELKKGRTNFLIGKYRLLAELGKGGMAQVFLAEHLAMERHVAIKLISSKLPQAAMDRFLAEVRAIAALDHPNIVHAYSVDDDGTQYYLVMEFVEGKTLDRIVYASGPLPWKQAAEIVKQTALGLDYAHDKGIIHCDLKPANIIVNSEGIVKILDLGLARLVGRDPQVSSPRPADSQQVLGTVDYMAPELALDQNHVDRRVDIYSLGCVLYFALTGSPPFPEGTLAERILKHQMTPPPDPRVRRTDIPPKLAKIISQSLAKTAGARFQTAHEMAVALEECLSESASGVGLVRARPLPDGDVAKPGAGTPAIEKIRGEDATASGNRESKISPGPQESVLATTPPGVDATQITRATGEPSAVPRKSGRWLLYGVAAAAILVTAGLLLIVFTGNWPTRSDAKPQTKPGDKTQSDMGIRSKAELRPEDDPEAFRKKLEEWMQSQMGPKPAKEPRK